MNPINVPTNIIVEDSDYFQAVAAFAAEHGKADNLQENLDRLGNLGSDGRVRLFSDFSPQSFYFVIEFERDGEWKRWISGGLIFHGRHDRGGDGGAPTFSVCLTPTDGWSIHT